MNYYVLKLCSMGLFMLAFCFGKSNYRTVNLSPNELHDNCDSANKVSLFLIFERSFDDSIICEQEGKVIYTGRIKTNRNISAVNLKLKIKKSCKTNIFFVERKEKLVFVDKTSYSYGYINRVDSLYSITYSNCDFAYY